MEFNGIKSAKRQSDWWAKYIRATVEDPRSFHQRNVKLPEPSKAPFLLLLVILFVMYFYSYQLTFKRTKCHDHGMGLCSQVQYYNQLIDYFYLPAFNDNGQQSPFLSYNMIGTHWSIQDVDEGGYRLDMDIHEVKIGYTPSYSTVFQGLIYVFCLFASSNKHYILSSIGMTISFII